MISQKPTRPTLLREAAMLLKGKNRILKSGDWRTVQELAALAQLPSPSAESVLERWKNEGRIFSIHHEGVDYFPSYALDPAFDHKPRLSLAIVIDTLACQKNGWRVVFWLGSSNSFLGGRIPKNVLADNPQAVLDAAKNEVSEMFI